MSKKDLTRSLVKRLWTDSSTMDMELICGTGTIRILNCHRPVLAIASQFLGNLLRIEECCLILPDFSPEIVEKFLQTCYLVEDHSGSTDLEELAIVLGIGKPFNDTSSNPVQLTVSVNNDNNVCLESKIEQLRAVNSGLSIIKGEEIIVQGEKRKRSKDTDIFSPVVSAKKPAKIDRLLASSEGKLVVFRTPAKKSRQKVDQEEKTESDDFDSGNEANGNGSDCEEDRKFERTTNKVNLKSVKDKRQIRIKVKCWDCSEIITTSMFEYERVISQTQCATPNFTANYRCQKCILTGGLPTEEELEAKKEERNKNRLEELRERRKRYTESLNSPHSLWKDNKKLEELKNQKLLCQFCGKQFSVVQGHLYWEHMNQHQNILPFKCYVENCNFGTHTKQELNMHTRKDHPPVGDGAVFQCDKCPLQSNSQKNLGEHIRKCHDKSSEKNIYECDQCFYRSTSVTGLLQHKTRWHKADEQKLSCQLCDTKLGNRKSIYEHMRNVHFVERQCKFCPFKHADNETVRRHIQEFHRDQMPYACSVCLYCTNRPKFLKKHMETVHSNISGLKIDQQSHHSYAEDDYA